MKSASNLDAFLKEIKSSNYYCQQINVSLKFQNLQQMSIKLPPSKDHQVIAKFPEIKFTLSDEIVSKLNQDVTRSRKTRNGLIAGYENVKFKHRMQKIHYFSQNDEDDIGVWQQAEDAFCVGFIVQKQGNYEHFKKRVGTELKKCLQKKLQQVVYSKNTLPQDSLSSLNSIQKILYKNFRFFLIYEPSPSNSLIVNRIMYYPDAKFLIKPIKLVPSKFTANKIYEQVLTFKSKYDYGYLSLSNNSKTKDIRFLLIDKFDPELNQNPPPMIGVWIAAERFQSKEEFKNYSWAVIMEYLRNPSLKIKLSINYQNTGIIFTIERPQKITAYIFQIIDQPKWDLKYSSQSTFKLPEDYVFNDQEVIIEEEKQESDIESIQNRSLMKSNVFFGNYLPENSYPSNINPNSQKRVDQSYELSKSNVENKSSKSNDEKDLEIRFLKKELEFYKNRCEMLQKMLNNPAMMQIQAMQMLNPLSNPLANHLAFNNNLMYQSLQPNNFPSQQMNFMGQNLNPQVNMMNNNPPNYFQQSQTLYESRASTNINKILNESDLYDQEEQIVPQPLPLNKQLAFNKKKTFEDESSQNEKSEKNILKSKQSLQIPNENPIQSSKSTQVPLVQFSTGENIQMSPKVKKQTFEYDYKNISFQDNSFENEPNSTHKFSAFQVNQTQIFGKSPDFKNFNFCNNLSERENQLKTSDLQFSEKNVENRKKNSIQEKDFSFDKTQQECFVRKISTQSPSQFQHKNIATNQRNRKDSQNSDEEDKKFLSRFQMKYNTYEQKRAAPKKETPKEIENAKDRYEGYDIKRSGINTLEKSQSLKTYDRSVPEEQNRTKVADRDMKQKYSVGINRAKTIQETLTNKKELPSKKDEDLPVSRINRNQTTSKPRRVVQNSDSDSDQELRNIALKYRK